MGTVETTFEFLNMSAILIIMAFVRSTLVWFVCQWGVSYDLIGQRGIAHDTECTNEPSAAQNCQISREGE
jgi:hypothetical protein